MHCSSVQKHTTVPWFYLVTTRYSSITFPLTPLPGLTYQMQISASIKTAVLVLIHEWDYAMLVFVLLTFSFTIFFSHCHWFHKWQGISLVSLMDNIHISATFSSFIMLYTWYIVATVHHATGIKNELTLFMLSLLPLMYNQEIDRPHARPNFTF